MRYRKLSLNGDYSFGNGQADFWKDVPEAVGQAVQTNLELWLGEWFLNIDDGTPYMQGVLGKYSQSQADVTIQDRVLGVQGVVSIDNYQSSIDPVKRSLSVSFDLNTIYGPTAVTLENYVQF